MAISRRSTRSLHCSSPWLALCRAVWLSNTQPLQSRARKRKQRKTETERQRERERLLNRVRVLQCRERMYNISHCGRWSESKQGWELLLTKLKNFLIPSISHTDSGHAAQCSVVQSRAHTFLKQSTYYKHREREREREKSNTTTTSATDDLQKYTFEGTK